MTEEKIINNLNFMPDEDDAIVPEADGEEELDAEGMPVEKVADGEEEDDESVM